MATPTKSPLTEVVAKEVGPIHSNKLRARLALKGHSAPRTTVSNCLGLGVLRHQDARLSRHCVGSGPPITDIGISIEQDPPGREGRVYHFNSRHNLELVG